MKKSTKMTEGARTNRTGMATSEHAGEMMEVPGLTRPSRGDGQLQQAHAEYLQETHALGTVPPPANVKGAAKTALQALKGKRAVALIDKTAERLAFERTGVRLYDALLDKFDVAGSFDGGPERKELQTIREEELAHARMLQETLETLGADPTAVTPSADLAAIESQGIGSVLADPRTTVGQCLHALMIAELADGEGWTLLRSLADEMGQKDISSRFSRAEEEERRHLSSVRSWVTAHSRLEAEMV